MNFMIKKTKMRSRIRFKTFTLLHILDQPLLERVTEDYSVNSIICRMDLVTYSKLSLLPCFSKQLSLLF